MTNDRRASPLAREAARMYEEDGASLREVAARLNVGVRRARRLVAEGGGKIYPSGHRPEGERQLESVRAFFEHGTVRSAARALRRAEQTVSRHLRQAGIRVRRGRPRTAGKPTMRQLAAAERSGRVEDSAAALGLNLDDLNL